MQPRILVTGATGNVGKEVLQQLRARGVTAVAGLRNATGDSKDDSSDTGPVATVDFETGTGPKGPFDAIFLMRPPHLTDPALFTAFLDRYDRATRIVFLSVQGADTKAYLPHAKIEKAIRAAGFAHVFVRPGYFMDNLVTTLWPELAQHNRIYLPAGGLQLDWISARDVAGLCVAALTDDTGPGHLNATGGGYMGFAQVCRTINATLGTSIVYVPAPLWGYVRYSRANGMGWPMIAVMLLLHYLPRASRSAPLVASDIPAVLGRSPESIAAFAQRHSARFVALPPSARR